MYRCNVATHHIIVDILVALALYVYCFSSLLQSDKSLELVMRIIVCTFVIA